eukprot:gene2281-3000_t
MYPLNVCTIRSPEAPVSEDPELLKGGLRSPITLTPVSSPSQRHLQPAQTPHTDAPGSDLPATEVNSVRAARRAPRVLSFEASSAPDSHVAGTKQEEEEGDHAGAMLQEEEEGDNAGAMLQEAEEGDYAEAMLPEEEEGDHAGAMLPEEEEDDHAGAMLQAQGTDRQPTRLPGQASEGESCPVVQRREPDSSGGSEQQLEPCAELLEAPLSAHLAVCGRRNGASTELVVLRKSSSSPEDSTQEEDAHWAFGPGMELPLTAPLSLGMHQEGPQEAQREEETEEAARGRAVPSKDTAAIGASSAEPPAGNACTGGWAAVVDEPLDDLPSSQILSDGAACHDVTAAAGDLARGMGDHSWEVRLAARLKDLALQQGIALDRRDIEDYMESVSGQDRRDVHASYVGGGGESTSSDEGEGIADLKAEHSERQEEQGELHPAARPRYEVAYWWDPEERWYVKSPGELRSTANHRNSFGRFQSYSTNRGSGQQHRPPSSSIGATRHETYCDGSKKPNVPKDELRLNLRLPMHGRNGGSTPTSPSPVEAPTPPSQVLTEQAKDANNDDDDDDDDWPWDTGEVTLGICSSALFL